MSGGPTLIKLQERDGRLTALEAALLEQGLVTREETLAPVFPMSHSSDNIVCEVRLRCSPLQAKALNRWLAIRSGCSHAKNQELWRICETQSTRESLASIVTKLTKARSAPSHSTYHNISIRLLNDPRSRSEIPRY